MALRLSFGLAAEAARLEAAVGRALAGGARTADIMHEGGRLVSTSGMTAAVIAALAA
jgi:3-isopropylmalate dehydrogenase